MTSPGPGARPGRLHIRRARLYLGTGLAGFALIVIVLLVSRPEPVPYTPGTEKDRSDAITSSLARSLPAGAPDIRFTDVAREAGIDFRHFHGRRSTQLPEDMGSGVAWGDYDGDGDPDLYLVNESGPLTLAARWNDSPARSSLYRNEGNGRFTDVTDRAGVGVHGLGMGAAWGDYDGDGDLDLVVTRVGTIVLFRNEADGTFADVSVASGLGRAEGFWTGASWADYDRDGDLDLYVTGYVQYRFDPAAVTKTSYQYGAVLPYTLNPSSYDPSRNLLFSNTAGSFRDVAGPAGVQNTTGRSLSASWCDFNGDGWTDLYIANDISDNAMFRNLRDGTFDDVSNSAWVADYRGAMGLGVGDWDNDGDLDIFITHWIAQENAFYENLQEKMPPTPAEPMHFIDQSDMLGLGQIALDYVGWGTGFADFDNDGLLDLYVANGSTFPREDDKALLVPMRNQLFWNTGKREGFYEIGQAAGEAFDVEDVARGAATADYDGDGDLDVALVVNGGPARLLRNDGGNRHRWLRVVLRGPRDPRARTRGDAPGVTTSFATGAVVKARTGPVTRMRVLGCGSSYLSQSPPGEVHFGLGEAEQVDALEIVWPDGTTRTLGNIPTDATVVLHEGEEPVIDKTEPPRGGSG
ncbi:MAG: CRTAC1 family protein [Acidobacteriota bacterium]